MSIIKKNLQQILEPDQHEIHKELISRAKNGDENAYYRLYKLYVQAMYSICIRMVVNQMDAEDLVQETFIDAFKKLDTYRGEASFGSWIKKIAINKSLNFIRRKKIKFTEINKIEPKEENQNEVDFLSIAPEKVHEHIKELPDKARVILNLYLLEDYKHKEIAEMLNISESTSKSQYLRAKELLKDRLKKEVTYEI